ncbi:hypothetical protein IQ276_006575 [Desmonostoc muscorum LEGE 12446]|uniref:Uncharacterized protein n=1 Tax=Desmonostoc muscorum LEGE 12446 TaxID=1828758 RepID=A0A8J7ACA6_DESMC|nr:hypothetical protein [Desmonostoc muscorum]MCF2146120.1 hypothetical protein [Desmonostoc muscorum LEGE 12446]
MSETKVEPVSWAGFLTCANLYPAPASHQQTFIKTDRLFWIDPNHSEWGLEDFKFWMKRFVTPTIVWARHQPK